MSALPNGWIDTDLASIAKIEMGQSPKGNFTNIDGVGLPLLGGAADYDGHELRASRFTSAPTKVCSKGDIILCIRATIGNTAIADRAYCLGRGVAGIRSHVEPMWLRYKLYESALALDEAGVGTTFRQIDKQTLQSWPVKLPPLPEQRRIAAKIDSLSAKSERARDNLDHIPRLAEKYKQAILAAAFRGELTRDWRSQAGRPYDWKDTTLGKLLVDIRYGTSKKCGYDAGAVGVLRIPNVQLGKISLDDVKSADFTDDERKKLRLVEGDILIIRSNGSLDLVGRSAVVDKAAAGMLFAGYLIRLRLNNKLASPEFVQLYLRTTEMRTLVERLAKSTSGVNNINSIQIQQLPILHPDVDEQHEIVRLIEKAFAWINRLAFETTSARKQIDHLDQAVLAKAFQGELVPQDQNDEPASVLLERIHAERSNGKAVKRTRRTS